LSPACSRNVGKRRRRDSRFPKNPAGVCAQSQQEAEEHRWQAFFDPPATAVSADLPALAPSLVVLTYPRNDKAAAERTAALRQALKAAKVEVVKVEAVDASRTDNLSVLGKAN
jgi:hypothetical protein